MKTYDEIQEEIQRLKEQADAIRQKEITGVIEKIRVQIDKYGLTAEDLGLAARRRRPRAAPKYRSPKGDKTWSGRGRRPNWVKAYTDAGGKLEELEIRS